MTPSVIFTLASTDDGEFLTVYAPGRDPLPATSASHANFDSIRDLCLASLAGEQVDPNEVADLFDLGQTVERKFQRLTERVAVQHGQITLDGDPVNGSLQEQILDFLDKGEDFGPLVNFYEKLATNPLGNVQDGLFDWINGQRESGTFTITPDGDVIGYKSVTTRSPEWRVGVESVYTPSRRGEGTVNGEDVSSGQYIEQVEGDVVEMPRSKVLNQPTALCGDGLHIGTYSYAKGFQGDTVLLVKFSPRDIVSLPDRNSGWKLRVCRYTVIGPCDEALDTPLYLTASEADAAAEQAAEQGLDLDLAITEADNVLASDEGDAGIAKGIDLDVNLAPGTRVVDAEGDVGTVSEPLDEDGEVRVDYDDPEYGNEYVDADDLTIATSAQSSASERIHGKGGATSQAAKGRGINPAQNPATGRFDGGRPGSARSFSNGRFTPR